MDPMPTINSILGMPADEWKPGHELTYAALDGFVRCSCGTQFVSETLQQSMSQWVQHEREQS